MVYSVHTLRPLNYFKGLPKSLPTLLQKYSIHVDDLQVDEDQFLFIPL